MNNQKRLCVYLLSDYHGALDRYALFFLRGLRAYCERIAVISESAIPAEEKQKAEDLADAWYVCESRAGNCLQGYAEALRRIGPEGLEGWDEVILTNSGLMGPVYPFGEMLSRMAEKPDIDFWGITAMENPADDSRAGETGISAYPAVDFLVFRERALRGDCFGILQEAAGDGGGELLTRRLMAEGLRWDCYVRAPERENPVPDFLLMDPVRAVAGERCPVFRRESFFLSQARYIAESAGEQPWELFRYLRDFSDYDTDMILEHLIRTCHQEDIVRTLRLTFVLPSGEGEARREQTLRTALVMHLYYPDLVAEDRHYALSMPENADIWILTDSEEKKRLIGEAFSGLPNRIEIRVTRNRGRDAGSLLVGAADLQDRYDLICFYHDKKTRQVKPYTAGRSFAYGLAECALSSRAYVRNVMDVFEENPRIGMLSGTLPIHGAYISNLGAEWGPNFELTEGLAEELNIRVPMDREHIPAAGMGDVFWYRTKALKPMFRKKWQYADFPEEPVGTDGTLLHAIERLYPFAVQEAGYLPGKVMPEHMAALEMDNLRYYAREYNRARLEAELYGDFGTALAMEKERLDPRIYARAQAANLSTQVRLAMKRRFPGWLYRGIMSIAHVRGGGGGLSPGEQEKLDGLLMDDPRKAR